MAVRAGTGKSATAMKRIRFALVLLASFAFAGSASADEGAQKFVQNEHVKLEKLLRQPASAARDGQVTQTLDTMVDYEELAHRAFGEPCPPSHPSCVDHWKELSKQQQDDVSKLLKSLVEKNYRKNLIKTLDYEVIYKGQKEQGGDAKIRTEAKSKLKPRDPAVQVDYVVKPGAGAYKVVDIVTEGSSLTKNYYDQFHKMLTTPGQGYPHIIVKLKEKIAKAD
jgi:phospholipid transport system substrate-binding protein